MTLLSKPDFYPPKTLIIGGWRSTCSDCGGDALPNEERHDTLCGYSVPKGAKGCGVVWENVTSTYAGDTAVATVKEMRPDLNYVGLEIAK